MHRGRSLVRNWSCSSSIILPSLTTTKKRPKERLSGGGRGGGGSGGIDGIDGSDDREVGGGGGGGCDGVHGVAHGSKPTREGGCEETQHKRIGTTDTFACKLACRMTRSADEMGGRHGEWKEHTHQEGELSSSVSYVGALSSILNGPRAAAATSPTRDSMVGLSLEEDGVASNVQKQSENDVNHDHYPHSGQTGWFWGEDGRNTTAGKTADTVEQPGQGALGAFWRETEVLRPTSLVDFPTVHNLPASQRQLHEDLVVVNNTDCTDTATRLATTVRPRVSHTGEWGYVFMGVATAKASVRSARNRAAELARLLSEGIGAPREECLAKADSAVRAAESAISCSNERLFELELELSAVTGHHIIGDEGQDKNHKAKLGEESDDTGDCTNEEKLDDCRRRDETAANLVLHIAQLGEQLELAQELQASALTARAAAKKRFDRDDEAATVLQARARFYMARLQRQEAARVTQKYNEVERARRTTQQQQAEELSHGLRGGHVVNLHSLVDKDADPREEGAWWTLAETGSVEEIGAHDAQVLNAVVKLQALVRSRLARSRTIAAVNARFVEYFDEEYQHPFYVCCESNQSQWIRPFGFLGVGSYGLGGNSADEESVRVDDGCDLLGQGGFATTPSPEEHAAAVIVQCAVRAARARWRMAERILSES